VEQNFNDYGLTDEEASKRLKQFGYNEIKTEANRPVLSILKRLWGPIPWILEVALIIEFFLGKITEASIIAGLLIFSAAVGETQERRAKTALSYLYSHLQVTASVLRNGIWKFIPARELVPEDKIRVKVGDIIPADCKINEGALEVDQSALTGESSAVSRTEGEMLYSGSNVRHGNAIATVTATGTNSYYGRTAELVRTAKTPGHLEKLLFTVVRYLSIIDGILAVLLIATAIFKHEALLPLIPFLMVLVIATVPVSMPASFTVANAIEAHRLAKEGVLVTGLSAIQEAASMEVLCIDKTGTLTENRQTIAAIIPFAEETEEGVLAWAAATIDDSSQNPLDIAILQELKNRSIDGFKRISYVPFDPSSKSAEAHVLHNEKVFKVVLGSPAVIKQMINILPEQEAYVYKLSESGARVLAIAAGPAEQLYLKGLIALADILREDTAKFVKDLIGLGIKIFMLTGDTVATTKTISNSAGLGGNIGEFNEDIKDLFDYNGFANIYPEDKFNIVRAFQNSHLVTGMTGDGINDAPALKQAEVGIAVSSATDVAKASAKVILTDPGLEDIIKVVSGGRRVYRRMLTWTITKIARTAELAILLTVGYIATGAFVVPLFLIILIVVLNDLVTLTLGTDRAWVSPVPEKWNVGIIAKLSSILTAGWLALGFLILWLCLDILKLSILQVQTLMFAYLIFSAQATIYITRVRDHFWSFLPSKYVIAMTAGNIVLALVFSIFGIAVSAVPVIYVLGLLGAVIIFTFLLDYLKIWFYRKTGVLGRKS